MKIYQEILQAKSINQKLVAILLDPDKIVWKRLDDLIAKINNSPATHIFVGGSSFDGNNLDELLIQLKQKTMSHYSA